MRKFPAIIMLPSVLLLAGCGTFVRDSLVHSYMGIPFDASSTSSAIADLARRSLAGDKQAQFELGVAFEEGRGVGQDLEKARTLYQIAANASDGQTAVYVPGVNGTAGGVIMVRSLAIHPGLPEAAARLSHLENGL